MSTEFERRRIWDALAGKNRRTLCVVLVFAALASGCATAPKQTESLDYRARAQTQTHDGLRVSAAVLSPQETLDTFKFPLAQKDIQPVWIEIENDEDEELVLMLLSIDPEYFAPSEIAWIIRGEGIPSFDERVDLFLSKQIPILISPHTTV